MCDGLGERVPRKYQTEII